MERLLLKPLLLILVCLFSMAGVAQEVDAKKPKKDIKKANNFFKQGRFDEALKLYRIHIEDYPEELITKDELNYRIGFCYYNSRNDKQKAIPFLENYLSLTDSIFEAHFFLGKLYHFYHDFDRAIVQYNEFKAKVLADSLTEDIVTETVIASVEGEIQRANNGKALVQTPVEVVIENLGGKINSEYSEYAPVISSDETKLVFTSRNPKTTGAKLSQDGNYFEDIFICDMKEGSLFKRPEFEAMRGSGYYSAVTKFKFSKPKGISANINTKDHDGAIQFSPDNKMLYIYRHYHVWRSEKRAIGWTEAHPIETMKEVFDDKAFEPSVSISDDEEFMYFSSDREGGYGGLDIYKSVKNRDGSWSPAVNLGPTINTPSDEDGPYVDPDGHTLYFSSKGHRSMGGYDVFKSSWSGERWSSPENLGYPINSAGNDIFFMMTPLFNRAYYSSDKEGGYGQMDIYRLTFPDERSPMAEIKGTVLGAGDAPAIAKLTVYDSKLRSDLYTQISDSATGEYMLPLAHGKEYAVKIEAAGFAPYVKVFEVPRQVNYYQFYQEIHHIHLKDSKGKIIGQQVDVRNVHYNEDSLSRETLTSIETKSADAFDKLKGEQKTNSLQVHEYSDVKFYVSEDSLKQIIEEQPELKLAVPAVADVTFLKEKEDKLETTSYEHQKEELPATIQKPVKRKKQAIIKMNSAVHEAEIALQQVEQQLETQNHMNVTYRKHFSEAKEKIKKAKAAIAKSQNTMAQSGEQSDEVKQEMEEARVLLAEAKSSLKETTAVIEKDPEVNGLIALTPMQESMKTMESSDATMIQLELNDKSDEYKSYLSKDQIKKLAGNLQKLKASMNTASSTNKETKAKVAASKQLLADTEASLRRADSLIYTTGGSKEEIEAVLEENKSMLVASQQKLLETQIALNAESKDNKEMNEAIFAVQDEISKTESNIIETKEKAEAKEKAVLIADTKTEIEKVYQEFTIIQDLTPEAHQSMTQTRNILISTQKELGSISEMFEDYEGLSAELEKSVIETKSLVVASQASLAKAKNILKTTNEYTPEIDSLITDAKVMLRKTQEQLSVTHEQLEVKKQAKELAVQRHQLVKLNEKIMTEEIEAVDKEAVVKAQEKIASSVENISKTETLFNAFEAPNEEIIQAVAEDKKRIEETHQAVAVIQEKVMKDTTMTAVAEQIDAIIVESEEKVHVAQEKITIISETEIRKDHDSEQAKEDVAKTITTIVQVNHDLEELEEEHPEHAKEVVVLKDKMAEAQESLVRTESLLYDYYGPTADVRESLKRSKGLLIEMKKSLTQLKAVEAISMSNDSLLKAFDLVINDAESSIHEVEIKLADLDTGEEAVAKVAAEAEAEAAKEEVIQPAVEPPTVASAAPLEKPDMKMPVVQPTQPIQPVVPAPPAETSANEPVKSAAKQLPKVIIYFDFDSQQVTDKSVKKLNTVISYLKANGGTVCEITGYTDSKGSNAYNQRLSERRAAQTRDYLVKRGGVKTNQLVTKGGGESKPIAPNALPDGTDNPEGRSLNRRVELKIKR